ncbi:hypothetical protein QBC46DRAFT_130423 [Diplogelasinospora grovesii]|uniref:Uncharacterized protein n=1 Tax=Diplogelasinospora grovesii TaxID=303347 RepID=A0AAN6N6N2_9PEZI|nr:hypothetical protein QBC46DRAFT_130423 [Diplogelasinospora grovesii]
MSRSGRSQLSDGRRHLGNSRRSLVGYGTESPNGIVRLRCLVVWLMRPEEARKRRGGQTVLTKTFLRVGSDSLSLQLASRGVPLHFFGSFHYGLGQVWQLAGMPILCRTTPPTSRPCCCDASARVRQELSPIQGLECPVTAISIPALPCLLSLRTGPQSSLVTPQETPCFIRQHTSFYFKLGLPFHGQFKTRGTAMLRAACCCSWLRNLRLRQIFLPRIRTQWR